MAHKTMVGGTSYSVTGGTSMVSGTTYNIKKGKTLVGGTGYDINFDSVIIDMTPYAMLYSDGSMVFQHGDKVESGKTLSNKYTGFCETSYANSGVVPWNSSINNIKNVSFRDEISPISIAYWFYNSRNLITINMVNFNWSKVTNMSHSYIRGYNLTGSPVCGNNVTNMYRAYANCPNLTGSPVCGDRVIDMFSTYQDCTRLKGSPVCGNNVTTMYRAYYNCPNLTGSPVCGDNVTNMRYTYYNCRNLTGSPVCGDKVTDMGYTYYNCYNLYGNAYLYNVTNVHKCFYGRNIQNRLNIYTYKPETFTSVTNAYSVVGEPITWTEDSANTCWYNTKFNIYIYRLT